MIRSFLLGIVGIEAAVQERFIHSAAPFGMRLATPKLPPVAVFFALVVTSAAVAAQSAPRTCYSAAETREKIAADKLAEPFPLMRAQAGEHHAEAIAVRLCSVASALVYEIDLLRRDGRLIHTSLDAVTGKPVGVGRP